MFNQSMTEGDKRVQVLRLRIGVGNLSIGGDGLTFSVPSSPLMHSVIGTSPVFDSSMRKWSSEVDQQSVTSKKWARVAVQG